MFEELYPQLAEAPHVDKLAAIRATLFDKQRAFLEHPSKRKVGVVGRRGGKSTIASVALAESGMDGRPGVSFYCGITRERAKSVAWAPLKALNRDYDLGLHMNDSELIAYGPGDARIQVTGADKMKEADKKRGDKYKIAIIDEAGLFEDYLDEMVREVVEPSLMDYNGPLWQIGTPNPSCLGFFHDAATTLPGWTRFHWTARDNPYVDAAGYFKDQCETRGLDEDDPAFQREYLGRWVKGGASLLYKFDEEVNVYDSRPANMDWRYVIGVDLGFEDPCAFVVWAYCPTDPVLYEVQAFQNQHLDPGAIADVIGVLRDKWSSKAICVVDEGGLGKTIGEGLRKRFGQYVIPAQKTEKFAMIEFMNGDLRNGRIKVLRESPLIGDWQGLHLTKEGHEDPTVPNHLADAALYGYRYARQYMWKGPEKPIAPEKAMEAAVRRQAQARKTAAEDLRWL